MRCKGVVSIFVAISLGIPAAICAPCDFRPPDGSIEIPLPLHPLMVAPLKNACALLVTFSDNGDPAKGAIAVVQPREEKFAVTFSLDLPTEPVGMALTRDESVVAIAGGSRIYFADVAGLLAGKPDALLGTSEYDQKAGTVSLALSRDEQVLFASDENAGTVTVIDFSAGRASKFANTPVRGRIAVDWAPTVLKMTADGVHLLVPVEGVRRRFNPPVLCPGQPGGEAVNPVGAILSLRIPEARARPENAVPRRSYAGCSPVRMELAQDGQTAFVTNREENLLRIMDVAKILRGDLEASIGGVAVGPNPIGLALVDHDQLAVVSNSNRWAKEQTRQTMSVIDIAGGHRRKPVVLGRIPVGVFPRDIAVSPDGRTVVVSNFGSNSLTLLDVSKLRTLALPAKSP